MCVRTHSTSKVRTFLQNGAILAPYCQKVHGFGPHKTMNLLRVICFEGCTWVYVRGLVGMVKVSVP